MKKFKLLAIILSLVLVVSLACACGDKEDTTTAGFVTFEAEGIDLTGLSGRGYSNEAREIQMIQGQNVKYIREQKKVIDSVSNGYFVGYFTSVGTELTFVINADAASTDNTLILRLGSEFGTMKITKDVLNVLVNETALDYEDFNVTGKAVVGTDVGYYVPFSDCQISTKFDLKAGENVIKLVIQKNTLGVLGTTIESVGPGVDCIKIKSTAKLTWDSLWEDNFEEIIPEA